jgi:hypothetical protein
MDHALCRERRLGVDMNCMHALQTGRKAPGELFEMAKPRAIPFLVVTAAGRSEGLSTGTRRCHPAAAHVADRVRQCTLSVAPVRRYR